MNIMRRLVSQSRDDANCNSSQTHVSQSQCDMLSLTHLNKLFAEIKVNTPSIGSLQQSNEIYEQKIYNLLPLFCKVFGSCSTPGGHLDMFEKFADLTTFTQMVTRLMVTEIRRRASSKTTENASQSIVDFLETPSTTIQSPSDKKGWILLSTLNLLVCSGCAPLIPIMTSAALSSTLVKCLYLFFDLPQQSDNENFIGNSLDREELTSSERRILLQRVFSQLLTRLCASQAALTELTRKDDLALLFNAITSWCPPHNRIWRKTAADVILIMAKNNVINSVYLHEKGCISIFVENMQRMFELGTTGNQDIVEMLMTLINFFAEVTNSSPSSANVLLDDFKSGLGYHFLVDFALKLEGSVEEFDSLKKLMSIVAQFTKIGVAELKPRPLSVNQLFIMDDFTMPRPNSKNSIRNLSAFNVFQTVWTRAKMEDLQDLILDEMITLYKDDKANYFILDSQNTLSQFAEKLQLKSTRVQEKYFSLLEFVVYELHYVPCKELISVSIIIKSKHSYSSSIICLKSLYSIIKFNPIFRDVYREVGILDIIASLLIYYAQQTDEIENDSLIDILMDITISIITGPNNQNCTLFNECGAVKHIFGFLSKGSISKTLRKKAFIINQQLILSNSGEEHLANMLALMHRESDIPNYLNLKSSILKSLLVVLRESHRVRALFRKVGGFVYVMSVLVHMEGSLDCKTWNDIEPKKIWNLLRCVFATLTTAMRYEPANAKFFAQEICSSSLTDSIRLLGCFSNESHLHDTTINNTEVSNDYHTIFNCSLNELPPKDSLNQLESACLLMRLLYDMAIDVSDKSSPTHSNSHSQLVSSQIQTSGTAKRPPHLSLYPSLSEPPLIIHSSVIISMFQLIPSIASESLREYLMELLRSLLKSERNQQVMCECGLISEILMERYNCVLLNEKHSLYPAAQYILERLSAQNIQPKELRLFLRLGSPLNCIAFDDLHRSRNGRPKNQSDGGPIALTRIKTLVSMTTPKDGTCHHLIPPPFVEFDLNQEGFSCLFLPSIAPVSLGGSNTGPTNLLTGAIVGNTDMPVGVNGGIGTGERPFPPQSGLTYTTWICVEKFSPSSNEESHNIRLLTIYRSTHAGNEYACFQIQIAARDKALLISTQEIPIFGESENINYSLDSEYHLRVWSPELIQEGQWHHIAVVLNRALLKNSAATIYIDGLIITNQKLRYISSVAGSSSGISNASPLYVNGFIGTPPQWRRQSRLVWKQGPCHLIEEALQPNEIAFINALGPNYIGSYQGCHNFQISLSMQQQIPEDRVIFGLNSRATSVMTLAKMRRVYSRFDCRQISKILGISTHENATPIYVLHNSAGHLCGPSRSLGAILIGNIGARCFVPIPVSVTCSAIGGATLLLGLVANSRDVESVYASVKALVCVIRANRELQNEMENINGYQTMAMLLRRKRQYLNSHVLHLTFNLVGTLDVNRKNENAAMEIQNIRAFKDLLSDQIDLWAQNELLKSLLEHFNELLFESKHTQESKVKNVKILRELGLLTKLLHMTQEIRLTDTKSLQLIYTIIYRLMNQTPRQSDLLYFGQFIAFLLPTNDEEKNDNIIDIRNQLLKIILQLITRNTQTAINHAIQEELIRILGFDWFLLFLQGALHKETVTIGLVNLMILLSNPNLYHRFKDGTSSGGWLKDTEAVLENRFGLQLLGFNVGTSASVSSTGTPLRSGLRVVRNDLLTIPGFLHLSWLMTNHVQQPKVYLVLFQALLGQYQNLSPMVLDSIESFEQLNLDNLWNCLFSGSNKRFTQSNSSISCRDLSLTILSMIHTLIWDYDGECTNFVNYPITLIQFIMYLYHNRKDFQSYCQWNPEFIASLCSTVISDDTENESDANKEIVSLLTNHSAKKIIMDFIRLIIIDTISTSGNSTMRPISIFELFLEGFSTCKSAQTELIASLMEHITSLTEVMSQHFDSAHLQQQHLQQQQQQQQQQQISTNIVLFISIVVDKLWQDCYLRDYKEILDCELKLLTRLNLTPPVAQNSGKFGRLSPVSELNLLYKSLNRTVLYLLSRPLETISDRMHMLEVIQRIHTNRQLILISSCNSDAEFYVCLTYCVLQLIDEVKISLTGKCRTTWHVIETGQGQTDEGAILIGSVARKIWDEIYLSKKSLLEDLLKINLAPSIPAFGLTSITPDISALRDTLYDPTLKVWVNYIESEQQKQRRKTCSGGASSLDSPSTSSPTAIITEKLANINKFNNLVTKSAGGIVSKIVGGTTGVVGSAISTAVGVGTAARKEAFRNSSIDTLNQSVPAPWTLMKKQEVQQWTMMHLSIINDLIELQMRQKMQSDTHLMKYVYDDWIMTEVELLIRERAIWGPEYGSKQFDKWKLDLTEGPHRMRKKLIHNELFYLHYLYRPELDCGDGKPLKYKLPISFDSKEYYKRFRPENQGLIERDSLMESADDDDSVIVSNVADQNFQGIRTSSLLPSKSVSSDQDEENSQDIQDIQEHETSGFVDISSEVMRPGSGDGNDGSEQVEMQTVLRLLEDGERISHMFRCARIQGLDTYEGLLLFGKEHFYLIDGFTLLKTREIRDIDSLPANMHDPIVPNSSPRGSVAGGNKRCTKKTCSKFAFEDIKDVHKRRYLLQPIALEVFSSDGRNSLLVFPRKLRNKVYARYMSVATAITDNAHDSLAGQKRNVNVETAGILSNLIGETSVTQRWIRGEISNFQYLMHLNTLAGRSYNDLMQYPVFPWVLADYTSPELDFTDPRSFRDFSRPMGAQTYDRLDQFKKRFNEWDDPNGETPPYHYGTFYSSAMIVASYLVRMEPFTQHFLRLQGGHFDLADRMFHSVGDAWISAARHNMADLKELIPEFFYLPEFLLNANRYDLGNKQSGVQLDDVILPPWAKNDCREFIRLHRAALECDYVSAHLHEWIDLIFGYKQHGPAAVEAVNVFHHLFYEGNVDIYTIDDPLKKNATIGFINNFGQIPKQLFKKPHPTKKVPNFSSVPLTPLAPLNSVLSGPSQDKVFFHNLDNLRPSLHPVKELRGAVGQIIQQEKSLLAVEQNKVLIPPQFNRYVAWGFADHSVRIGPYESERALFIWESNLLPPNGEILCCTVPNARIIITAGTNSVISVWKLRNKSQQLSMIQNLYGHTEAVTCLTSSASYGIIVSGSRDRTCIIWDLNRLLFVKQLGGGPNLVHTAPIAAIAINDLTGDIATCASNMLYLWSINGDMVAYINTLNVSPSTQGLSQTQILCVIFSTYNEWDPLNVIITGSSDGVVRMWSLDYVQVLIDDDDRSEKTSSDSSTPTEEHKNDDASSLTLNVPPSKDEIVRRLSIASATAESNKEDDNETSEENCSDDDRDDWDLVQVDDAPVISISHSKSSTGLLTPLIKSGPKAQPKTPTVPIGPSLLDIPKIRTSKSDTSLIDSFILVSEQDCARKRTASASVLKPGHKWKCQFVFRSKLTMHTAFERRDNTEPAAITALAISKDHKTVFVGDARGRVFSWSVSEGRGMADHWVKDDLVESCTNCGTKFSFSERRHHCRSCGHVFCAKCSKYESEIIRLKITKPVRVCQNCYSKLQSQNHQLKTQRQK